MPHQPSAEAKTEASDLKSGIEALQDLDSSQSENHKVK